MKRFIIFTIGILILLGIYRLWTINERGFDNYLTTWFESKNLNPPNFDCHMNERSRTGFCLFQWPKSKVSELKSALFLQDSEKPISLFEGCGQLNEFKNADLYSTDLPPGPIFKGNSSTSFLALWYSNSSEKGCVDVEYPYG